MMTSLLHWHQPYLSPAKASCCLPHPHQLLRQLQQQQRVQEAQLLLVRACWRRPHLWCHCGRQWRQQLQQQ
jgi:hypothetical protein